MRTRLVEVVGVEVRITSYEVGQRFSCRVDNVDPGTNIARATGGTREEAEAAALESATLTLELMSARQAMKEATENLRRNSTRVGTGRQRGDETGKLELRKTPDTGSKSRG